MSVEDDLAEIDVSVKHKIPVGSAVLTPALLEIWPYLNKQQMRVLPAMLSHWPHMFPKHSTVGKMCGRGRQAVQAVMAKVVEVGLMTCQERFDPKDGHQMSNEYTLANVEDDAIRAEIIAKLKSCPPQNHTGGKSDRGKIRQGGDVSPVESVVSPEGQVSSQREFPPGGPPKIIRGVSDLPPTMILCPPQNHTPPVCPACDSNNMQDNIQMNIQMNMMGGGTSPPSSFAFVNTVSEENIRPTYIPSPATTPHTSAPTTLTSSHASSITSPPAAPTPTVLPAPGQSAQGQSTKEPVQPLSPALALAPLLAPAAPESENNDGLGECEGDNLETDDEVARYEPGDYDEWNTVECDYDDA